jgi:hypothetical protein
MKNKGKPTPHLGDLELLLTRIFLQLHLQPTTFFSNSGEFRVRVRTPGLRFRVLGVGLCCGVAKLPFTNNKGKLRAQESKPKFKHKQKKTKTSFPTVIFSKVHPLYKCRSVSFYREASRLFTYRDYPRVKRIKTECARLIL